MNIDNLTDDLWEPLCRHINAWCAVEREPEEMFFVELRGVIREVVRQAFSGDHHDDRHPHRALRRQ
jgi:hypothetical protein